jgi:hypothetical protein
MTDILVQVAVSAMSALLVALVAAVARRAQQRLVEPGA